MDEFSYKIRFCFSSSEPSKKRFKEITSINFHTTHRSNLINFSQYEICEPAFAEGFSNNELLLMNGTIFHLVNLQAHSQGVEYELPYPPAIG